MLELTKEGLINCSVLGLVYSLLNDQIVISLYVHIEAQYTPRAYITNISALHSVHIECCMHALHVVEVY